MQSQRHKATETTGSVTTTEQEVSELDLKVKPLQLSSQTATTAAPRVQGSHWTVPSYSGRALHYIIPVRTEQEPEHCSAVCQETTRTAALKLKVARQTYIYD